MRNFTLLDGVSSNGAGPTAGLPRRAVGTDEALVQIDITGVATVDIEARVDPSMPWVSITQVTASDLIPIAWVPEVRAVVTGYTSGTITVKGGFF